MKVKEILSKKEEIISLLKLKNFNAENVIKELEDLYSDYKKEKINIDSLRQEGNEASLVIKNEKDVNKRNALIEKIKNNKKKLLTLSEKVSTLEAKINDIKLSIPNIPSSLAPVGKDDTFNKVIKESPIPNKSFEVKPHWELLDKVSDQETAALLSGSRFVIYQEKGAMLFEGLKNFLVDFHLSKGYKMLNTPVIVKEASLIGTGQLPKFKDDLYKVGDDSYLIPTAEVTLTNTVREKILKQEDLPIKLFSYSSCFRKEAGASGKDTRGIKRLHQFNKVEMVHILERKDDIKMLKEMLESVENILLMLEIPYRVLELSTGELTFSSTFTYDIEVWMPGQKRWMEISSISTCSDFQSERMNSRVKHKDGTKEFVYTQNGSGIAMDRAIAAIMENHQNAEGEILIPDYLKKYLYNIEKI